MMIEIENLSKNFSDQKILRNITINIPQNKIVVLLGPNGAGKTTLVKTILGLLLPESGSIKINGKTWDQIDLRRNIAYLPEKFTFYSTYKLIDVLSFYLKMNSCPGNIKQIATDLLIKVGLEKHLHKKVSQISKGQLQRLALATCMVPAKDLIILDEPFSGLDPFGISELKDWIREWKDEGKTVLINTHLIGEISNIVEHVIILNEGSICETMDLEPNHNIVLDEYFVNLIKEKRHESN